MMQRREVKHGIPLTKVYDTLSMADRITQADELYILFYTLHHIASAGCIGHPTDKTSELSI